MWRRGRGSERGGEGRFRVGGYGLRRLAGPKWRRERVARLGRRRARGREREDAPAKEAGSFGGCGLSFRVLERMKLLALPPEL